MTLYVELASAFNTLKGGFEPLRCVISTRDQRAYDVEVFSRNGQSVLNRPIARTELLDAAMLEAFILDSRSRIERDADETPYWTIPS